MTKLSYRLPPNWFDSSVKLLYIFIVGCFIITTSLNLSPKLMFYIQPTEDKLPIHELDLIPLKQQVFSTPVSGKGLNEIFQKSLVDLSSVRIKSYNTGQAKLTKYNFFSPVSDDAQATWIDVNMHISYPHLIKFIEFWQNTRHTVLWQKVKYYETNTAKRELEAHLHFLVV